MWGEVKLWINLSVFCSCVSICEYTPYLIALTFASLKNKDELAALSLVDGLIFPFIETMWYGVQVTASIFISRANGMNSKSATKRWTIISVIFLIVLATLLSILCILSKYICYLLNFDVKLISNAYPFILSIIPYKHINYY